MDADPVVDAPIHPLSPTASGAAARHRDRLDVDGLVLYGGTGLAGPRVRRAVDAAIGAMPSTGSPGDKYQTGLSVTAGTPAITRGRP